jgi:hypothetical protein
MTKKKPDTLEDIIPQRVNANAHTPRGMGLLEKSISERGWIGAITAAADGEVFDGSARRETLETAGLDDAIFVRTDGTRPVVLIREDIPTADDPRARELAIEANRIAQLNLAWDANVLAQAREDGIIDDRQFTADEMAALAPAPEIVPGNGGDDFDTTPQDGPTRAQLGDLWIIGGVHRLVVGDCTDPANVDRLMGGERADICFTSPPYNAGVSAQLRGNTHLDDSLYVDSDDDLTDGAYLSLLGGFTHLALEYCKYAFVNIQPLAGNKVALIEYQYAFRDHFADVAIWNKGHAAPAMARRVMNSQFEYMLIFSSEKNPSRSVGTADWRGTVSNVYDGPPQRNNEYADIHGATMPVHVPTWICDTFTRKGNAVYEPFMGTGTTLIAAHRTGRRCYGCEISPRYADVILRRAEAEGLTVERAESQPMVAGNPS